MGEDIKKTLSTFDSLILVRIDNESRDIFYNRFIYELGSFSCAGFADFGCLNDVINSIYRSSSICEGIGYYEYINQIREGIYFCLRDGKRTSFILPLRMPSDEITHYFLMTVNKGDDSLNILFMYFDQKNPLLNIDDFSSGTFKDKLTGLFNYRTLTNHIKENKRRGFLVLYDLNGFKKINDDLGHETGDDVLKEMGNFLISIASMREVYYRRSGDEFMVLVFEQDLNYVLSLINQLEKFIEDIPLILKKNFTCSAAFGILELETNNPLGYELQSKLTDLAMYQAKYTHKRYHYISHQDALSIIEMGDLDKRISEISKMLKR